MILKNEPLTEKPCFKNFNMEQKLLDSDNTSEYDDVYFEMEQTFIDLYSTLKYDDVYFNVNRLISFFGTTKYITPETWGVIAILIVNTIKIKDEDREETLWYYYTKMVEMAYQRPPRHNRPRTFFIVSTLMKDTISNFSLSDVSRFLVGSMASWFPFRNRSLYNQSEEEKKSKEGRELYFCQEPDEELHENKVRKLHSTGQRFGEFERTPIVDQTFPYYPQSANRDCYISAFSIRRSVAGEAVFWNSRDKCIEVPHHSKSAEKINRKLEEILNTTEEGEEYNETQSYPVCFIDDIVIQKDEPRKVGKGITSIASICKSNPVVKNHETAMKEHPFLVPESTSPKSEAQRSVERKKWLENFLGKASKFDGEYPKSQEEPATIPNRLFQGDILSRIPQSTPSIMRSTMMNKRVSYSSRFLSLDAQRKDQCQSCTTMATSCFPKPIMEFEKAKLPLTGSGPVLPRPKIISVTKRDGSITSSEKDSEHESKSSSDTDSLDNLRNKFVESITNFDSEYLEPAKRGLHHKDIINFNAKILDLLKKQVEIGESDFNFFKKSQALLVKDLFETAYKNVGKEPPPAFKRRCDTLLKGVDRSRFDEILASKVEKECSSETGWSGFDDVMSGIDFEENSPIQKQILEELDKIFPPKKEPPVMSERSLSFRINETWMESPHRSMNIQIKPKGMKPAHSPEK